MKTKEKIVIRQEEFINSLICEIKKYVENLDKSEIQTILLSGSVSRGDFFPGDFGGMVDLIVIRKANSKIKPEEVFGPNKKPFIPYHCVALEENDLNGNVIWLQIDFRDKLNVDVFSKLDEARKFSILEGQILYDTNQQYEKELAKFLQLQKTETKEYLNGTIGYINYLLSDYKTDRWFRRDAFVQLHENLNTAIRMAVKCLYYINESYQPAEDRYFYYSYSLVKLPPNYTALMTELQQQQIDSYEDYKRRENLFKTEFLSYLENQLRK